MSTAHHRPVPSAIPPGPAADALDALAMTTGWSRRRGELHPAALDALARSGLLRSDRGSEAGHPTDGARALVECVAEVAQVDPAAAWALGEHRLARFVAELFPPGVRARLDAEPDALLAVGLGPTGVADPAVDGGIVLRGRWEAVAGAAHSRWQLLVAVRRPAEPLDRDELRIETVVALVPTDELQLSNGRSDQALHGTGLRGAGRRSVVAGGVAVPGDRVLPLLPLLTGDSGPSDGTGAGGRRTPLAPLAPLPVVAVLLGAARAAHRRVGDRTRRTAREQIALTSVSGELARMEEVVAALAEAMDERTAAARQWTAPQRRAARESTGLAVRLGVGVVSGLAAARRSDRALAELHLDVCSIDEHALPRPMGARELYARALHGLHL